MIYNTNLLISKYDCASLNLFYLRDFYLDFFDTEFGDALREIEVSVYVRFDPADRPYKLESNAWLDSRKLNKPKVRFLASSRKLKVQYITSIKGSENEFPIVGTIRKDEDETISPENFSDYCLEFLDILLQNLPKALKQNESFNAENFMEHLKSKRAGLPITEETLERIKKAKKEFDYEKVRWIYSSFPTGNGAKPIPKAIPIQYDKSHTPYIGKFNNGQFWGRIIDGYSKPSSRPNKDRTKYVYSILHKFSSSGKCTETVWERTSIDESAHAYDIAENKLKEMLLTCSPYRFDKIKIELFETTIDEMSFGLVNESDEEEAKIQIIPEGYMLIPPWTGYFET